MSRNVISKVDRAAIIATAFVQTCAFTVDSAAEWAAS